MAASKIYKVCNRNRSNITVKLNLNYTVITNINLCVMSALCLIGAYGGRCICSDRYRIIRSCWGTVIFI